MAKGESQSTGVSVSAGSRAAEPKRRQRYSGDLPRPRTGEVPYAKSRPELKGLSCARITKLIRETRQWQELMKPELDRLDAQRRHRGKEQPHYTFEELETVLLYQRVCGLETYKEVRDALAGDKGAEPRRLLGFDRPRSNGRKRGRRGAPGAWEMSLRDGVPAESTVSRYRTYVGVAKRAELWETVERALRSEQLAGPELRERSRILNMDGTPILTHYQAPIFDRKTKKVVNEGHITAPDAGYVSHRTGRPGKSGSGWNVVSISTPNGDVLDYRILRLHESECDAGLALLKQFGRDVLPQLGERQLRVLTADSAFHKAEARAVVHELGIIENIHVSTHAKTEKGEKTAAQRDAKRYQIDRYPNWYANGHREIFCKHGRGTAKTVKLGANGKAIIRVQGKCPECGVITITPGQWRIAKNPDRFVPCSAKVGVARRDWQLGNPFTFHSLEATAYGNDRHGHNEGLHGVWRTRFKLKGKRWMRRYDEVRTDTAMIIAITRAITLEQERRVRAANAREQAPPEALAA